MDGARIKGGKLMLYKDPTDVLSVDVMLGVVNDSKFLTKSKIFAKYQYQVRPSQEVYLERYIERICP